MMLAIALVVGGCSGAGSVDIPLQEAAQQGAIDGTGSADLHIPFPDDDADAIRPLIPLREVSGQTIYHAFPVDAPLGASEGVLLQPGLAQIYAADGELAYAIYRIPYAGARILDVVLNLSAAGDDCWLAMADYSRGAWSFIRADQLDGVSQSLSDPRWHSPKGHVHFALIAANGSQLNLTMYKSKLHYGDVISHEVAQIGSHESLSIITLEGRPGIFYCDAADSSLRFSHATSSRPSFAEDWVTSTLAAEGMPGVMQSAAVWQGRALIAYTKQESGELWLACSTDSSPDAASDWQHSMLLDGERISQHVSLEVVNGQPALACFRGDPADADQDSVFGYIHYMRHSGSDAATGWLDYELSTSGFFSSEPSLAVLDGRPCIAFAHSGNGKLYYAAAMSADPQSALDWEIHPTGINALAGRLRLASVGGVPVLLYPRTDGLVGYLCGLKEEPLQTTDWLEWNSMRGLVGGGASFDLLSIDGRPELLLADYWEFPDGQGGTNHNQATRLFRPFDPHISIISGNYISLEFGLSSEIGLGYCGVELEGHPAVACVDGDGGRLIFSRLIF